VPPELVSGRPEKQREGEKQRDVAGELAHHSWESKSRAGIPFVLTVTDAGMAYRLCYRLHQEAGGGKRLDRVEPRGFQ